jgi:hypothetical protein
VSWWAAVTDLGLAIVEADSQVAAGLKVLTLLTKAGDVRVVELPGDPPAKFRNRLLTTEEANGRELAAWGKQATRRLFRPGADVVPRPKRRRRRRRKS